MRQRSEFHLMSAGTKDARRTHFYPEELDRGGLQPGWSSN